SASTRSAGRSSGSPNPPPPPISVIKPSPFSSRNGLTLPVGNLSIIQSARITPTRLASPSFPPSRPQGAQIVLSIRDWYMTGLSTGISERKPRPPRHLPAPPESCHSSRRTMTADAFASRASTGRLCVSPSLIHTVAGMPSSPSLAPQPPPLPEPTLPLRQVNTSAGIDKAIGVGRTEVSVVSCGDALGTGGRERFENRIDHGHRNRHPRTQRRRLGGAHHAAGREYDLDRAERAVVDRQKQRCGQAFECDLHGRAASRRSGVEEARHLR